MKNDIKCNAYALKGKDYCFTHDPDSAEKRAIARREGGNKHVVLYNSTIKLKRGKVKSVIRFIGQTVCDVREGVVPPQIANSVFIGCNVLLRCFEVYNIEEKLSKIEKYVEKSKKGQ